MSVQRPNITRNDCTNHFSDCGGRSSKKRFVDPQSPKSTDIVADVSTGSSNNILYLVLAAAGISMGLSVFLYREIKRMKFDIETMQKKIVKETKESNEDTVDKITQLAQNMQDLHNYIKNNADVLGKLPPPEAVEIPEKKIDLPKSEFAKTVEIHEGGPSSTTKVVEEENGCEDGVCPLEKNEVSA